MWYCSHLDRTKEYGGLSYEEFQLWDDSLFGSSQATREAKVPHDVQVFGWVISHGKMNTCDLVHRKP